MGLVVTGGKGGDKVSNTPLSRVEERWTDGKNRSR
jgi:hypothetical protein